MPIKIKGLLDTFPLDKLNIKKEISKHNQAGPFYVLNSESLDIRPNPELTIEPHHGKKFNIKVLQSSLLWSTDAQIDGKLVHHSGITNVTNYTSDLWRRIGSQVLGHYCFSKMKEKIVAEYSNYKVIVTVVMIYSRFSI